MRSRADYEASVRALSEQAEELTAAGQSEEAIARTLVATRNALKRQFREGVPLPLLQIIEQRNSQKYGNPLGPTAEVLLLKYGSWRGVIGAACRHADFVQKGGIARAKGEEP